MSMSQVPKVALDTSLESACVLPPGWQKHFSNREQKHYYFHSETGRTQWDIPSDDAAQDQINSEVDDANLKSLKRKLEDPSSAQVKNRRVEMAGEEMRATTNSYADDEARVAIIVPFRDLHEEQKRKKHMDEFVPYMTKFLQKHQIKEFHVFIVEQSNDGKKFNRGKLLNCGFDLARQQKYNTFIFHDVDLLPSDELGIWYSKLPPSPLHIARVWDRYNGNKKYFGGIVSFSKQDFEIINGYPNNFWGWGGEDDELFKRVKEARMLIQAPKEGSIQDLENMDLSTKLSMLKKTDWKCMVKWELLQEHEDTWQNNGLNTLQYNVVQRENLEANASKVTVDLGMNHHWSDTKVSWDET